MIRYSLILCLLGFVNYTSFSQQLNNNSFETWPESSRTMPTPWIYGYDYKCKSVIKSTDAHSGKYSIQLKTIEMKSNDSATNTKLIGSHLWLGEINSTSSIDKITFTGIPDSVVLFYKYYVNTEVETVDELKAWSLQIAIENDSEDLVAYCYYGGNEKTSYWKRLSIPFKHFENKDAQSLFFLIKSSETKNAVLLIDDVEFIYNSAELIENTELILYPNPSSETVCFKSASNKNIQIFSADGLEVSEFSLEQGALFHLNVQNFKNGSYLVLSEGKEIQRFVVNR